MNTDELVRIRANLIELDKGLMQIHSAIRGILSMIEKTETVTIGENDTLTKLPENKV